MLKTLLIAASLILAPETTTVQPPASEKPAKKVAAPEAEAKPESKAAPAAQPAIDLHADNPPPTNWDRASEIPKSSETTQAVDENTLTAQLFQTLLALIFVCLLIYLVGRFGLSRLTGLRTGAPTKSLSLNEKLSLDAKNALYIVEVKGKGKLLLGGGDQGLQMICNLNDPSTFEASMNRTHTPLVDSTPDAEVQKEHHG